MILATLLCTGGAVARPIEEVVVYEDPFSRWDGTRWYIESEVMVPSPVWFAAQNNVGFRSHALQVRVILACDKDAKLSRRAWEVHCEVEDIGLQVVTQGLWHSEHDLARVQQVLNDIDADLTGSNVQLQVDDEGTVRDVDLEGLSVPRNERQRLNQEVLRQVLGRVISGFHMEIPSRDRGSGQWLERNSLILSLPTATGIRGSTQIVHQWGVHEGIWVVQSLGEGTLAANIPVVRVDTEIDLEAPTAIAPQPPAPYLTSQGPAGPIRFPPPELFRTEADLVAPTSMVLVNDGTTLEVEATFKMRSSGVAVFDPLDGFITERVWVVDGAPTASSGGGTTMGPYRQVGRLRMLEPEDNPDVGPTEQVAPPGRTFDGMQSWAGIQGI